MDNASHQMEFGQFFTTNETLLDAVHRFIKNDPPIILEPCCGRGDIVNHLLQHPDRAFTTFDLYEIDTSIELASRRRRTTITNRNHRQFTRILL